MAGFYGDNIIASMSAMTDFNFDKIYSNRFEMDSNSKTDGVYQGRYVLVEYSQKFDIIPFQIHKPKMGEEQEDGKIYYKCAFLNKQEEDYIKVNQFSGLGVIYYNEDEQSYNVYRKVNKDTYEQEDDLFFEITTNPIALKDTGNNTKSDFIINQAIDNEFYGGGKGYDSTVWIKRVLNEGEKYIEVGSLNAVEPQFDLYIDSPLRFDEIDDPLRKGPYFDDKSTGLVKNLHIQAPWRFAIGDIEFNEEGFKPEKAFKISSENGDIIFEDKITLSLGSSETQYANAPDGVLMADIQKLNINLPSIGNTISKVWDMVYGEGDPNNDGLRNFEARNTTSLQGILNSYSDLKQNSIPFYKDNNIVSSELVKTDWIIPSITENQEIVIEHKKINDTSLPVETTSYNFGYYTINVDEAGHIRTVEEAELIINCGGAQL